MRPRTRQTTSGGAGNAAAAAAAATDLASLRALPPAELATRVNALTAGTPKTVKQDGRGVYRCPFPRAVCGKDFTRRSSLRMHLLSHCDVRPHSCSLCSVSFARVHDLTRHIKAYHEKCKPFVCSLCPATFARRDALQRHEETERRHTDIISSSNDDIKPSTRNSATSHTPSSNSSTSSSSSKQNATVSSSRRSGRASRSQCMSNMFNSTKNDRATAATTNAVGSDRNASAGTSLASLPNTRYPTRHRIQLQNKKGLQEHKLEDDMQKTTDVIRNNDVNSTSPLLQPTRESTGSSFSDMKPQVKSSFKVTGTTMSSSMDVTANPLFSQPQQQVSPVLSNSQQSGQQLGSLTSEEISQQVKQMLFDTTPTSLAQMSATFASSSMLDNINAAQQAPIIVGTTYSNGSSSQKTVDMPSVTNNNVSFQSETSANIAGNPTSLSARSSVSPLGNFLTTVQSQPAISNMMGSVSNTNGFSLPSSSQISAAENERNCMLANEALSTFNAANMGGMNVNNFSARRMSCPSIPLSSLPVYYSQRPDGQQIQQTTSMLQSDPLIRSQITSTCLGSEAAMKTAFISEMSNFQTPSISVPSLNSTTIPGSQYLNVMNGTSVVPVSGDFSNSEWKRQELYRMAGRRRSVDIPLLGRQLKTNVSGAEMLGDGGLNDLGQKTTANVDLNGGDTVSMNSTVVVSPVISENSSSSATISSRVDGATELQDMLASSENNENKCHNATSHPSQWKPLTMMSTGQVSPFNATVQGTPMTNMLITTAPPGGAAGKESNSGWMI